MLYWSVGLTVKRVVAYLDLSWSFTDKNPTPSSRIKSQSRRTPYTCADQGGTSLLVWGMLFKTDILSFLVLKTRCEGRYLAQDVSLLCFLREVPNSLLLPTAVGDFSAGELHPNLVLYPEGLLCCTVQDLLILHMPPWSVFWLRCLFFLVYHNKSLLAISNHAAMMSFWSVAKQWGSGERAMSLSGGCKEFLLLWLLGGGGCSEG